RRVLFRSRFSSHGPPHALPQPPLPLTLPHRRPSRQSQSSTHEPSRGCGSVQVFGGGVPDTSSVTTELPCAARSVHVPLVSPGISSVRELSESICPHSTPCSIHSHPRTS